MGNQQNVQQLQEGQGYRIIKVFANGPGEKAGLTAFLDYIVDIGNPNESDKNFFKILNDHEEKELELGVYNLLTRKIRKVKIVPSKKWENSDESLLGIWLRHEQYENAHELTYKIANIIPNSPAQKCGLQQGTDFIIGFGKLKYQNMGEMLDQLVASEYEKEKGIQVVVYNSSTQKIRLVFVEPNVRWGGKGSLGIEFGSGFLNQVPQLQEDQLFFQKTSNLEEEQHEIQDLTTNIQNQEQLLNEQKEQEIIKEEESHINTEVSQHIQEIVDQTNTTGGLLYNLHRKKSHTSKDRHNSSHHISHNPFEKQELEKNIDDLNEELKNQKQEEGKGKETQKRKLSHSMELTSPEKLSQQEANQQHSHLPPMVRSKSTDVPCISDMIPNSQDPLAANIISEHLRQNQQGQQEVNSVAQKTEENQKVLDQLNQNLERVQQEQQKKIEEIKQKQILQDENHVRVSSNSQDNTYTYFCKKLDKDYQISESQLFQLQVSIHFRPVLLA